MSKSEIRIVAGSLRGRKLMVQVHDGMRPTPQMVREALFSILGNAVPGRVFYDVFAGTGVCGLEAVSRGATRAALIENDAKQVAEIQRAIDRFGVGAKVQVLKADGYRWAERWVTPTGGPVNVFLSPPFPDLAPGKVGPFLAMIVALLAKIADDSVLTIQAEDGFPVEDLPDGPAAWDIRRYGRNLLLFRVKGEAVASGGGDGQNEATTPDAEGET
jgi:16S rRNA (guanine966-N2)-methyltransferase